MNAAQMWWKRVRTILFVLGIIALVLVGLALVFVVTGLIAMPVLKAIADYSPDLLFLVLVVLVFILGVMIGRAMTSRDRY